MADMEVIISFGGLFQQETDIIISRVNWELIWMYGITRQQMKRISRCISLMAGTTRSGN